MPVHDAADNEIENDAVHERRDCPLRGGETCPLIAQK